MSTEIVKYWVWGDDFVCNIANLKAPFENSKPYNGEKFIKPMYNPTTNEVFEGAKPEELAALDAEKINTFENRIIEAYEYLMLRALSSSMGKYGSFEYLQLQKEEYELKYKVAKGLIVNNPIAAAIEKEMLRDFTDQALTDILTAYGVTPAATRLEKMHQLIVFRYEYAEAKYNTFKSYAIDFRTKCRTFVELGEFTKLETALVMAWDLPQQLTDQQISDFYGNFDAL